jgi:DNA-binding MarR family transcriptional regulator
VLQALIRSGPSAIQEIAREAMITHSAASQTVSQMVRDELVYLEPGQDGRQRIVHMGPAARKMLPRLRRLWASTASAAAGLNGELSAPLERILTEAIEALERRPFAERIKGGREEDEAGA